ncbi:PadR family transcriptional regulator [Collimonas fungivorans]|uniref:PadR family transcriptional regulator n=1 Tax=Collimonas fungivorans TaxID=158899 RepID=UPI000778836D|nr:PadR family transcriptional regulator [Collimonas fungivorans]
MFGHRGGCDRGRMHQGHERQHRGGGLFERGGRREGGRGGRMFEQGSLRLVILKLLQEKPRHGYEVIKAIEELVGGDYSPSPGVIYPTLTLLEELGYTAIEAETGGKKLYRITAEGSAFLAENSEALALALQRLETAQRASGSSAPELRRAIQNFRMALHTRLEKGELSQDQIHAIVDAIDLAAVKIERI